MRCIPTFAPLAAALILLLAGATPALAAPACPAKEFGGFLEAFTHSLPVQQAFTQWPLPVETVDADAQPEPRPVTRHYRPQDASFPLIPSKARQKQDRLTTTVRPMSGGAMEAKLAQADSGYQLRFLFRKTAGCWTLVKKSDDSL
jgi:hypothetical protein